MTPDLTPVLLKLIKKNHVLSFFTLIIGIAFFPSCESRNAEKPFLIGEGYGINSTTLLVDDLNAAKDYFKDTLGFSIDDDFEEGNFDGSMVSSAAMADLSVLELLSINDSVREESRPSFILSFLESNKGVRMYSLSSSSIDSTSFWLTSQGFQMDSIQSHRNTNEAPEGWSWDDGEPESYSLDFESKNPPAHLPRFVKNSGFDYQQARKQWRTYYGYGRRYSEHPNGVVGTSAIRIAVENLQDARKKYQKMGFTELEGNDSIARFRLIRNQEIHLLAPNPANEDLSEFLRTNNSGVFALRLEVVNLDSTYHFLKNRLPDEALKFNQSSRQLTVLKEYAYGIQLEFVQESEEQGIMAQMLRLDDELDSAAAAHAAGMYEKYCALCHGSDREGYAADNAPSLRSKSLLATSKSSNFLRYTIQYGRSGTAMAGYLDRQGGPMEFIDIEILLQWLYETSEVEEPIELSREPVLGDLELGETIYANNCAVCHGADGEGITAPALGNPMLLATATDHFLRYAIAEGRDSTPMIAFKETLNSEEIDAVTAFLRSRASGWDVPQADTLTIPPPEKYVLNPEGKAPKFHLREGKYVPAEQVMKAMKDSLRMVILDARSEVAWRQTHIPGAIPVPYYEEPENFVNNLPNDSTSILVYCACPHAASQLVVNTLKRHGFKNTAIIDEGVLVWAQLGYPVQHGN
jgi:mono/diheme cytochrome c family protein/rhodanese-related sulfurtransferase/catechol 2,3-dioxygenase-like lactoylglutathione lyase family enzyme